MIDLASASLPVDVDVIDVPGGFAWWYVDLVDEGGDGVVLIWSFGLPFLPGIGRDSRSGRPSEPRKRPSLTLSLYEGGTQTAYLFQEHGAVHASWTPPSTPCEGSEIGDEHWVFGDTRITSRVVDGRRMVDVQLDCPVPSGGRIRGTITVRGPCCTLAETPAETRRPHGVDGAVDHAWAPVSMVADGRAELDVDGRSVQLHGRAYHDRNAGRRPLHDLGIRRWSWGRLAFSDREVIWYQLEPEAADEPARHMVLEVLPDGSTRSTEGSALEVGPQRWSPFGLRWPTWIRFEDVNGKPVEVRFHHKVDDSPFYHRYLVEGICGEERARGIAELVVPGRMDMGWMRPLVRMRVHRVDGPNSFWLPLFTGDQNGRLGRLVGQLRSSPRRRALEGGA